jgi:hypothetical protein
MPAADASDRTQIAQIAALERWALHCTDRAAATAPARKALVDRWDRIVDPAGELEPAERAKRAKAAKSAHYRRMALVSAQKRRRKASREREA